MPRQQHAAGSRLRCQYIEIEQVPETARVIGSRPFWLWGFEHGLNEHGVAIGNHTVFTKDSLEGEGLIGMDLVRLGLERGRSAEEAVETIAALLQRHGQGGSGYFDKSWPYHNSFSIADRSAGYLLETSDRHWAVRRIADVGSASNHLAIGNDWDSLAEGTIEHAIARGWCSDGGDERFDFAAAYRDTSLAPEIISSGRHRRTCALLETAGGRLTAAHLRAALRDHYESGAIYQPRHSPDDERYFSICMHAEPVGTTTASAVVRLPASADEFPVYWASLGSPCVGVFLPLYIDAEIPAALSRGGEEPSRDSPWWRFKQLLSHVERDPVRYAARVRARWDELEARLAAEAEETEAQACEQRRRGDVAGARALLSALSQRGLDDCLECLESLIAEVAD